MQGRRILIGVAQTALLIIGCFLTWQPRLALGESTFLLVCGGMACTFCCSANLRKDIFSGKAWPMSLLFTTVLVLCATYQLPPYVTLSEIEIPALALWLIYGAFLLINVRGVFFWYKAQVEALQKAAHPRAGSGWGVFFAVFFATFAMLALFWTLDFFPWMDSPDVDYQWAMGHGIIPLHDIHTAGHMLYLVGLWALSNDNWLPVLLNLLMVSWMYATFGRYLWRKGVPAMVIVALTVVINALPHAEVYMYPWKDTPYLFCAGMATYFSMRLYDTDFRPGIGQGIVMGLALAFSYLFRHNGLAILLCCGVLFVVWFFRKHWWKALGGLTLSLILAIGGVSLAAYQGLGMEHWPNGFSLQLFAYGIATAVMEDGNITEEEYQEIDELLGLYWIEETYSNTATGRMFSVKSDRIYDVEGFFDEPGREVYNNEMVVSMTRHPLQLISLYFRLLPRNIGSMARGLLYSTPLTWKASSFFYNGPFFFLLLLAVIACWSRKRFARRWPIFLPIVLNMATITLTTATGEPRYLLPTFALALPIGLYVFATADTRLFHGDMVQ